MIERAELMTNAIQLRRKLWVDYHLYFDGTMISLCGKLIGSEKEVEKKLTYLHHIS